MLTNPCKVWTLPDWWRSPLGTLFVSNNFKNIVQWRPFPSLPIVCAFFLHHLLVSTLHSQSSTLFQDHSLLMEKGCNICVIVWKVIKTWQGVCNEREMVFSVSQKTGSDGRCILSSCSVWYYGLQQCEPQKRITAAPAYTIYSRAAASNNLDYSFIFGSNKL